MGGARARGTPGRDQAGRPWRIRTGALVGPRSDHGSDRPPAPPWSGPGVSSARPSRCRAMRPREAIMRRATHSARRRPQRAQHETTLPEPPCAIDAPGCFRGLRLVLRRALGGLARGPAEVVPRPQQIRAELLSREEGAELARAVLEWTGWPQVRLVSVLKEVAKECELPLPGLDTVTVNRWVTGKQCPTAFYVRLLLALLDRLLLGAAMDTSLATKLEGVGRREFLLRVAAAAGLSALAPVGRPPVNALA